MSMLEKLRLSSNLRYDWTGGWSGDVWWLRVSISSLFKPTKINRSERRP